MWRHVQRHRAFLEEHGLLVERRRRQLVDWTRAMVRDRLLGRLETDSVRPVVTEAESAVLAGDMTPSQAADTILAALDRATSR